MKELIVAIDLNNAIGYQNNLLCHLPDDLKRFKELTLGKNVIMGRKTWDSLPVKPLPNRKNIVLTSNSVSKEFPEVIFVWTSDLKNYLETKDNYIVIGGSQLYREAINIVDILWVTEIQNSFKNADTWFPKIDENIWKCESLEFFPKNKNNKFDFYFKKYIKRNI